MNRFLPPPRGARPVTAAPQPVVAVAAAMPAVAAPRLPPRFRAPPAPAVVPVVKLAAVQPAPQPQRVLAASPVLPTPKSAQEIEDEFREKLVRIAEFLLVVEDAKRPETRDSVRVTADDARYFGVVPFGRWRWPDLEAAPADWRILIDNPERKGRILCGRPVELSELPEDIVAEARRRASLPRSHAAAPAPAIASSPATATAASPTVQLAASDEVDADYDAAVTTPEAPDPYDDDHVAVREPDEVAPPVAKPARPKRVFKRPTEAAEG